MPSFFPFRRAANEKKSEAKQAYQPSWIPLSALQPPLWSPRDPASLARHGFMANPVIYRCVSMVAQAAASIPWVLYENQIRLDQHPLLTLLDRPNHYQSGGDFAEYWHAYLQLAGNSYLEAVEMDGALRELHVLRPDRVHIIPGARGRPAAYEYRVGHHKTRFACRTPLHESPVLHMRLFHPLNDYYGMSPLEAASVSGDVHYAAGRWSKALLDNSARPSGALVYKNPDGPGNLTQEQFQRLKSELAENYEGSANAGRPLLLEGGLEWMSIGHSPKDMDFIETKHVAAREIALAFGVPPMLLGIPGDNTYANYAEANRGFWRQTILPLLRRAARNLNHWLVPRFGDNLRLDFNQDHIQALASERESLWKCLQQSKFLTLNEQRVAAGYPPLPEGDRLADSMPSKDDA